MRRRGAGADGVPEHLLRLRVADWPDPGPPPPWWDEDGEPWELHCARREWSRARRQWVRESGGSIDAVNLLCPPDLDAGEVDPRFAERERTVLLAVAAPRVRREA